MISAAREDDSVKEPIPLVFTGPLDVSSGLATAKSTQATPSGFDDSKKEPNTIHQIELIYLSQARQMDILRSFFMIV